MSFFRSIGDDGIDNTPCRLAIPQRGTLTQSPSPLEDSLKILQDFLGISSH